jgi:hypothetical protein
MNQISRELGLFQQDVRNLSTAKIKKLQSLAFLVMQLKRFNREELKIFYKYCDGLLAARAKKSEPEPVLGDIEIDDSPVSDPSIMSICQDLNEEFKNYGK